MYKFRDDIELIKCDLYNPPDEVTNVHEFLDGVMGPWMVGTAEVDDETFPGPVYRDKNGNFLKHKVNVYNGDYLVKRDGNIFYIPLTLFCSLLKKED